MIESCGYTDEIVCSAIGNSYGDIYETHLEWAKNSEMNKQKDCIPEGFMEIIMPIIRHKL